MNPICSVSWRTDSGRRGGLRPLLQAAGDSATDTERVTGQDVGDVLERTTDAGLEERGDVERRVQQSVADARRFVMIRASGRSRGGTLHVLGTDGAEVLRGDGDRLADAVLLVATPCRLARRPSRARRPVRGGRAALPSYR